MRFFEIEFAPLLVLLERKLQAIAMLLALSVQVYSILWSSILVYYILFKTTLWWLCSLYLFWCYFVDTDARKSVGRRSEWLRHFLLWQYAQKYFPISLVKSADAKLDPNRNYLFCCFPHGLIGHGASCSFGTDAVGVGECFPNHTAYGHTLSIIFYIPFIREIAFGLGCLPSSKECLDFLMSEPEGGNISALSVGGAEEAFFCNPGVHKILLRRRKGFIKIALRNGCSLVPVYSFGETQIYGQYEFKEDSLISKFQKFIKKKTGVALIFVKGRGIFQKSFGILPHRHPINVVVGEPIDVQKTENPTQEQIDNLHQFFEKKLVALFETQKKHYLEDHETAHLEIV